MTKECKKEIESYLEDQGYMNTILFTDDDISRDYLYWSTKGVKKGLATLWDNDTEKTDKYFLEFIGFILRKHKITEIGIVNAGTISKTHGTNGLKTYYSYNWKFESIQ